MTVLVQESGWRGIWVGLRVMQIMMLIKGFDYRKCLWTIVAVVQKREKLAGVV